MILIYRFLIAAATLIAVITFLADWNEKKFSFLPKYGIFGILIIAALILVILERFEASQETPPDTNVSSPTIFVDASAKNNSQGGFGVNISGGTVKGLNYQPDFSNLKELIEKGVKIDASASGNSQAGFGINISGGSVEIFSGDSKEVKEKKLNIIKSTIALEIVSDFISIDKRLSSVSEAFLRDPTDERIYKFHNRMTKSLAANLDNRYNQTINQHRIELLRSEINGLPFSKGIDLIISDNLREAGYSDVPIKRFFTEWLGKVEEKTDMLYKAMNEPGLVGANPSDQERGYANMRVSLQQESLFVASNVAFVQGMSALRAIDISPSDVNEQLKSLIFLRPQVLLEVSQIDDRLRELIQDEENIIRQKKMLLAEGKIVQDQSITGLEHIADISPTDSWQQVYGKAKFLRDSGQIASAVIAFNKYGEMFGPQDKSAYRYSETAKAFTQSINDLGVAGGCYVFDVRPGGPEAESGIHVGDIFIKINGNEVSDMKELTDVYSKVRLGEMLRYEILRLNRRKGDFDRVHGEIRRASILRGVMPI